MGKNRNKHKFKRKRTTRHETKPYACELSDDVTTWGGELLNPEIRNNLKLTDVVRLRVVYESRGGTVTEGLYVGIRKFLDNGYMLGVIDDPYTWNNRPAVCDGCGERGINLYCCLPCDYDLCDGCVKHLAHTHEHEMVKFKHPYCNGTVIKFKKHNISEIPNWTEHTCKLIEKYKYSTKHAVVFADHITGV